MAASVVRDIELDVQVPQNSPSSRQDRESSALDSLAEHSEYSEGGYGWIVVAGCAIIMFFVVGISYSWGVVQTRLVQDHLGSDGVLSFVGSTAVALISVVAFINTRIIRWLGTRHAAFLAMILIALGQILSGWTTGSVGGLFVTNGLVMGLGFSLAFMTCSSLPAQYFSQKRGMANGIVYSGGGFGGAVWTLSLNSLMDKVGVPWMFRITGLITLAVGLPATLLLRERTRRATPNIEWRLFLERKFFLLFFGCALATFPLLVPPFFIPLYATSLHTSTFLASLLLAVFNLSSAVGRIGFGFLCDIIGPVTALMIALLLSAVSMLAVWPVSNSLTPLVIFIVLNGMGNGGFFSSVPSVVAHVYGQTRVANALAMVISGWAFGYLLGAPIAGWILGAYGGSGAGHAAFRPAIYFAGSLSVIAALLILTMRQITLKGWKMVAFV